MATMAAAETTVVAPEVAVAATAAEAVAEEATREWGGYH